MPPVLLGDLAEVVRVRAETVDEQAAAIQLEGEHVVIVEQHVDDVAPSSPAARRDAAKSRPAPEGYTAVHSPVVRATRKRPLTLEAIVSNTRSGLAVGRPNVERPIEGAH